ncbi:MAG: PadR family transcriptional regulator [Acidimicrobiales bacterium]|nr:PadR family transcriptional regulator [Acidimicrobiales bacterium]
MVAGNAPEPNALTTSKHHAQIMKGVLDMCLLARIAEEPSYGYELVTTLNDGGLPVAGEGSIYPVLKRLKQQGLIEGYLVDSPSGPARKYYRATPEGDLVLADWKTDWTNVANGVNAMLATRNKPTSKGKKGTAR